MHPASYLLMAHSGENVPDQTWQHSINKRILMNLGKGTVALRVNRTGLLLKPRYWKQSVKCTHMETMLVAAMTFGRLTSCVQPTVSTVTLSVAYQPPLGKHFEPCHV